MPDTNDIVARATADLQRALASVERARETLIKAEAEAADLQGFLRTLERYVGPTAANGTERNAREHGKNFGGDLPKPGTRARALGDAAVEAIKAAGRPLPIGDLLDVVLAAGFTLGGADQKSNLAGYLSRDPRVVSLGRNVGWTIVETEEAAPEPGSNEAASSSAEGGPDDRTTLTDPDEFADLMG
ncbi:MAG TPA: hypothetical protein VF727_02425 [Allosphingosinicella sp.]|jgi:hypothetical protein